MIATRVDRDRLLSTFLELVAIDRPTGHEEVIGAELERRFAGLGCTTTRDEIGNLVAVLPGWLERLTLLRDNPDTAGASGAITYWSPTSVYLTIAFHGRKAHAGVEPEKGISAVQVAADAIAAMPLGRIDEETLANIGTVTGGEARNVIPDSVTLLGMARSHDQAKLDDQLHAMRRACEGAAAARGAGVDFETEEIYRTYRIAEDARPYREAAAAITSLGVEVVPRTSGGGTDGNYVNAKGIPCVALATGMVDEHATSEHIAVDDLVTAAGILTAIVTQDPPHEQDEEPTP